MPALWAVACFVMVPLLPYLASMQMFRAWHTYILESQCHAPFPMPSPCRERLSECVPIHPRKFVSPYDHTTESFFQNACLEGPLADAIIVEGVPVEAQPYISNQPESAAAERHALAAQIVLDP
jgi:hypothetical protein